MARWSCAVALLALAGCRQLFGLSDPIPGDASGSGSDGKKIDGNGSGSDGSGSDGGTLCLGVTGWQVCVPMPTQPVTLSGGGLDTEGSCSFNNPSSWSGGGQSRACIIVGTTITGTNVYATGQYPLVLVASDSISISNLDASSHGGAADPGAGAGGACGTAGVGDTSTSGAGGGAGGTFIAQGGDGAAGGVGNGGIATSSLSTPTTLRGGCRGGNGGDATSLTHGSGGSGGGAVYLVAGNQITITTGINASGAYGSGGGAAYAGGGGGGAGGMIYLNAPTLSVSGANLVANGGGGGAGGSTTAAGGNGSNPSASTPTTPATGATTGGGHGGDGYALGSPAADGTPNAGGGGGGGGGGGYIRANVALSGATSSPAADIR